MLKYYRPLPLPNNHTSDIELQIFNQERIKESKALQEVILILIPENLISVPLNLIESEPCIQQTIQKSLQEARLDDERLRIERSFIPHIVIYIPNTLKGKQFLKIAKAIGDIPLHAPVVPKNQNQGYWLKTLHYFWQARGVVLAHQLLGLIQDPLEYEGVFSSRLPFTSIHNLKLHKDIDIARFQVLVRGQRIIKQWTQQNGISYPFSHPLELFLEILKQEFLIAWDLSPCNLEANWLRKDLQRANFTTRVRICEEGIWQESPLDTALDIKWKQEYLEYLHTAGGWNNYWILAMQGQLQRNGKYNKHLEPYLEAYSNAARNCREIFVDEFDWRGGQPFKKLVKGQKVTNSPQQIQGSVNSFGYIQWFYP